MHGKQFLLDSVYAGIDEQNLYGRLDFVGTEKVQVAGQEMTCTHYRVAKDVPHDIWYDAQERLVRDAWVSGGHRTVVEMTGVQH